MKYLLFVAALLIGFSSTAQYDTLPYRYNFWKEDYKNFRQMKRQQSLYAIEQVKEGALLVRLKTCQNQIDALLAVGDTAGAEKVRKKQYQKNMEIVNAFKTNFDFCPVYFFYSTHTLAVKNEELDGIFLNDQLEIDPSIKMDKNFYLIAEYSYLLDETTGFPSREELKDPYTFQQKGIMGFCLRVMDKYFVQLRRPFPFYIATDFTKKKETHVFQLNAQFETFYENRYESFILKPHVALFWYDKSTDLIEAYYQYLEEE